MLKAEKLLKLRGCILRSCQAARMPYQARPCADTNSIFNQTLRQWQFQRRLQTKKPPNPCKERRTVALPTNHCHPYTMGEYTLAELRGGRYMPDDCRRVRVTHEQRTMLDRYAAKTRFGGSVGNPLVVDERQQPGLANYMRDVMEHNSFYNQLYCIDFYNTYDVEGRGAPASKPNYMDPDEIARLLELLSLGIELTPEQLAYLQQFLLQLSLLDPAEMAAYLAMFEKLGLLSSSVLMFLQKMMADLNIDPQRLQALNLILGVALEKILAIEAAADAAAAAAAAAAGGKLGAHGYGDDLMGAGAAMKRSKKPVYGPDGYDANGFDANGFDRNGFNRDGFNAAGFDRSGFDRNGLDRDGLKRGEAERLKREKQRELQDQRAQRAAQVTAKPYQKPDVQLARKKAKKCGDACKGYYEPWDADLSWEEAQELVERAVTWRMMRLDWDQFNFTRGLEKYVAELERSKPHKASPHVKAAAKTKVK